jgi:hypothetical protein
VLINVAESELPGSVGGFFWPGAAKIRSSIAISSGSFNCRPSSFNFLFRWLLAGDFKSGFKKIIRDDEAIRNRFFTEEKVLRRLLNDEEILFRIKKGLWKTIRFNEMDVQILISFCEVVEEEYRIGARILTMS